MFSKILLLYLQSISCFYKEIEGVENLTGYCSLIEFELTPGKYYWFNLDNEKYLLFSTQVCVSTKIHLSYSFYSPDPEKSLSLPKKTN